MNDSYQSLVENIIEKQASILGKAVAVRRARSVVGLEVGDDGKVTAMPGNTNQAFEDLVGQFKALSGAVGLSICKQAAAEWHGKNPASALPPSLL